MEEWEYANHDSPPRIEIPRVMTSAVELFDAIYRRIKPLLFRLDPETAHRLTFALLSGFPTVRIDRELPELAQTLFGRHFSNPVGLAAGLDKDVRAAAIWQTLGFGFAEMGTITPRPQLGNPSPRLWRLPGERALINRLGFPGEGMYAAARRMQQLRRSGIRIPIALNFGPNKQTPPEKVIDDYVALMASLGSLADFVVVNLSSPNTPGLRDFQAPEQMKSVVSALRRAGSFNPMGGPKQKSGPPLMVKIAPDLTPSQLDSICGAALEASLDGIVATNTTVSRDVLRRAVPFEGGLSGEPLREKARGVIRFLHDRLGSKVPIIGVGGVASAADAWEHIRAGASLIELYTGLIYEGPALAQRIKLGLSERLQREGLKSISDLVGLSAGARTI